MAALQVGRLAAAGWDGATTCGTRGRAVFERSPVPMLPCPRAGGRVFETLFKLMVWTMALFSVFSALVIASKRAYPAALVMLFTQLPAIFVYRRCAMAMGCSARCRLPLRYQAVRRLGTCLRPQPRLPPSPSCLPRCPCSKVVTSVGSYARHLPLQATRTAPRARIDPQVRFEAAACGRGWAEPPGWLPRPALLRTCLPRTSLGPSAAPCCRCTCRRRCGRRRSAGTRSGASCGRSTASAATPSDFYIVSPFLS